MTLSFRGNDSKICGVSFFHATDLISFRIVRFQSAGTKTQFAMYQTTLPEQTAAPQRVPVHFHTSSSLETRLTFQRTYGLLFTSAVSASGFASTNCLIVLRVCAI